MQNNSVLTARGIGKTVKSGSSDLVILREIDLAVTRGEVHAEENGKRTLVAVMQQTLMVMRGKADRAAEPRHTTPQAG